MKNTYRKKKLTKNTRKYIHGKYRYGKILMEKNTCKYVLKLLH